MWNSLSNISFYEKLLERRKNENIRLTENDVDINKICRTCLRDAYDENNLLKDFEIGAMNINLDGKLLKMIDMVKESTGLQIEESDFLPHQICNSCIQNVCGAYFFRLQSCKAKNTLLKLIAALTDDELEDEDRYENIQHLDETISNRDEKYDIISINDNNDDDDDDNDIDDVNIEGKCELMEIDLIDSTEVNDHNDDDDDHDDDAIIEEENYREVQIEYIEKTDDDDNNDDDDDDDDDDDEDEEDDDDDNNTDSGTIVNTSVALSTFATTKTINTLNDNFENVLNQKKSKKKRKEYLKCSECSEEFILKKDLHEHIRNYHPTVKAFECDTCHSKFSKVQTLKRHIKIHQDDQKNKLCTFCGKRFTRSDDLKRHIRTHTNERPYICNICPKSYKQTSELKEHMVTHSREKVYNCEICGKCLLTRNGYYVHMKVHAGVKNHKCNYCGKKYVTSGELNSHIRHIHDKDKPYACKYDNCDRKFSTKLSYDIHQRSHTGERPFSCSICDKKLATSSSLSDHLKIHTGEKRFFCDFCQKIFNSHTSYKKHLPHHNYITAEEFTNINDDNNDDTNNKILTGNDSILNGLTCRVNFTLDDSITNDIIEEDDGLNIENNLEQQQLSTLRENHQENITIINDERLSLQEDETANVNGQSEEVYINAIQYKHVECQYLVEEYTTTTTDHCDHVREKEQNKVEEFL